MPIRHCSYAIPRVLAQLLQLQTYILHTDSKLYMVIVKVSVGAALSVLSVISVCPFVFVIVSDIVKVEPLTMNHN